MGKKTEATPGERKMMACNYDEHQRMGKERKTPRPTRYRRLTSRIQSPATTRRHQQHHEEDPELFVDTDIQLLAKWTWHDVLRVAYE